MRMFADRLPGEEMLWRTMCILSLCLFLVAVMLIALLVRQRRFRWLWLAIPVACISYFMEQCFGISVSGSVFSQTAGKIVNGFESLPNLLQIAMWISLALIEVLLARNIYLCERSRITPMSLKEATDSLPAGVLWYASGARVLLVNQTMEDLCRTITGAELEDGAAFRDLLMKGELLPSCKRVFVGGNLVILLPDGSVQEIRESVIPYESHKVHLLLAHNITEAHRKTQELTRMREKVEMLERRLQKVNREIVAMTAEREVLNAKIRIHDELGGNLLSIRRYLLNGGTEDEKAELTESLRRSVLFLKNDLSFVPVQDEYELLISTAERLGLAILISGELPQTEPHKSVIATAIHECFTNALRHARGDELRITLSEKDNRMIAEFTNNGEAPEGEIIEKGGLKSLREMIEQAGGNMLIRTRPMFTIKIRLPREEAYEL